MIGTDKIMESIMKRQTNYLSEMVVCNNCHKKMMRLEYGLFHILGLCKNDKKNTNKQKRKQKTI